jgi:hypothetical protein
MLELLKFGDCAKIFSQKYQALFRKMGMEVLRKFASNFFPIRATKMIFSVS